jgi:chemotaxis protein methyltransferase CheR
VTPDDFAFIADYLKKKSGLIVTADKGYLLESRLSPVARKSGLKGLDELIGAVRKGDAKLAAMVVEAMTTNESFFFRDIKPFDQFRDNVLPALLEARAKTKALRVWSAACSSGQEPYSLAMIIKEQGLKLKDWKVEFVGTDLSNDILTRAKAGIYSQFEVQRGLPVTLLVKYFTKTGDQWQIKPEIRAMVAYRIFNLLDDLAPLGRFDVVFCRNVLIYFDAPTKAQILDRIAKIMPPDGFLFLGGAETVVGITDKFAPKTGLRGIYTRSDVTATAARAATG